MGPLGPGGAGCPVEALYDIVARYLGHPQLCWDRLLQLGVSPVEPGHDISARMDLSLTMPIPNGGIDAKVNRHEAEIGADRQNPTKAQ